MASSETEGGPEGAISNSKFGYSRPYSSSVAREPLLISGGTIDHRVDISPHFSSQSFALGNQFSETWLLHSRAGRRPDSRSVVEMLSAASGFLTRGLWSVPPELDGAHLAEQCMLAEFRFTCRLI